MKRVRWTTEMIETLIDVFPIESNKCTAEILGVSLWSVKHKAAELGISKFEKSAKLDRTLFIKAHFYEMTFSEMAVELGISISSVRRIAAAIGLKRSEADRVSKISSSRINLVKKERRRIIFGLEPVSKLKVVTNRPRIMLRTRMKSRGYLISEDRNILYYPENIQRNLLLEKNGLKLGLKFMPLPIEHKALSPAI